MKTPNLKGVFPISKTEKRYYIFCTVPKLKKAPLPGAFSYLVRERVLYVLFLIVYQNYQNERVSTNSGKVPLQGFHSLKKRNNARSSAQVNFLEILDGRCLKNANSKRACKHSF